MRGRWAAIAFLAAPLVLFLIPALCLLAARAFLHIPLDWGEGWNAYHAADAMAGRPLYPAPSTLMFNNYPPLSFYAVGLAGLFTGDDVAAGRLISIASLLVLGAGVGASLRALGARGPSALFGALFCVAQLTLYSDFVGLNAPQLLAHAVAIWGFMLLVRRPSGFPAQLAGVALLATGFFIKHMLVVQPLVLVAWLAFQDRRQAARLAAMGLGLLVVGLVACRLLYGINLLALLFAPRDYSPHESLHKLWDWVFCSAPPLLVSMVMLLRYRDVRAWLVLSYLLVALAAGSYFYGGAGIASNAMFEVNIALSLCVGLMFERLPDRWPASWVCLLLIVCVSTQVITAKDTWERKWRQVFTWDYAMPVAETRRDLALLSDARGPVLCDMLSLCYWAGRHDPVDLFNLVLAWHHGGADERDMVALIEARHYAMIQVSAQKEPFETPAIQAALRRYRLLFRDGNGEFLVPVNAP